MTDLVEWLTAQLYETEKIAREASGPTGVWEWQCNHLDFDGNLVHPLQPSHDLCAKLDCDEITIYDEGGHGPEQSRHIAHNDPASALAVVASFRAILTIHSPAVHQAERYGRPHGEPHQYCVTCIGGTPCECCPVDHPDNQWPCPTVRALVSGFSGRDGYEADWGPT